MLNHHKSRIYRNLGHYNNLSKFFTNIWDLKLPSKFQIHFWKVANKFVPILYNLRIRKLVTNTICLVCQEEEDTVGNLFWDCNFTRQVLWDLGVFNLTINRETSWKKWLAVEY